MDWFFNNSYYLDLVLCSWSCNLDIIYESFKTNILSNIFASDCNKLHIFQWSDGVEETISAIYDLKIIILNLLADHILSVVSVSWIASYWQLFTVLSSMHLQYWHSPWRIEVWIFTSLTVRFDCNPPVNVSSSWFSMHLNAFQCIAPSIFYITAHGYFCIN